MTEASTGKPAPIGLALTAAFVALAAWAGHSLATHPGFQPVATLRTATPVLALMMGAAFTHGVARLRMRVDVDGEFNPAGRALFLGVVMLAATSLSWLLVTQALPASLNAMAGTRRVETGVVAQKLSAGSDPDCAWRLEVTSPSIARALQECVARETWSSSSTGAAVLVEVVAGPLGAELLSVHR